MPMLSFPVFFSSEALATSLDWPPPPSLISASTHWQGVLYRPRTAIVFSFPSACCASVAGLPSPCISTFNHLTAPNPFFVVQYHSSPGAGDETITCKACKVWVGWKGSGHFVEKVRASLNSLWEGEGPCRWEEKAEAGCVPRTLRLVAWNGCLQNTFWRTPSHVWTPFDCHSFMVVLEILAPSGLRAGTLFWTSCSAKRGAFLSSPQWRWGWGLCGLE